MLKSKRSSIENLLDIQLEGLMQPPETSLMDDPWHIAIILSAGVIIGIWKWHQQRSMPSQVAKRKIKALSNAPKNTRQDTALELSSLLRQGLEVARLDQFNPEKTAQWKDFLNQLNKACYDDKILSDTSLNTLFDQALFWLNKK